MENNPTYFLDTFSISSAESFLHPRMNLVSTNVSENTTFFYIELP